MDQGRGRGVGCQGCDILALAVAASSPAAVKAGVRQVIYLGGLGETRKDLSPHLRSRHETGEALRASGVPVTEFRAAVIVGSGSLSFELIRYFTERVPVMITPRWVSTRCQPIAPHADRGVRTPRAVRRSLLVRALSCASDRVLGPHQGHRQAGRGSRRVKIRRSHPSRQGDRHRRRDRAALSQDHESGSAHAVVPREEPCEVDASRGAVAARSQQVP